VSFVQRKIEITITLVGSATFQGTSANTLTLKNLRMQTKVVKAGGATKGQLTASIYGMTLSQMNELSTLGMRIQATPRNVVTMKAGDDEKGMFTVFQGNIVDAYADMNAAPQTAFRLTASIGSAEAVAPVKPTSYAGGVDINVILSGLAKQMNLVYETSVPNGIIISNPYYCGSAWTQMREAADTAGISCTIDDGILAAWPRNGARKNTTNDDPVEISIRTGMRGYPAFTKEGLLVTTLFNPALKFGGKAKVVSSLTPANGTWAIFTLDHSLDCQLPNGQWFSTLGLYNPSAPVVTR